jgi:hypothetical protein
VLQNWFPERGISWYRVDVTMQDKAIIDYHKFGMLAGSTVWEQYLISFYWVCTTVTGNGSIGDVMPQNMVEIIYCIGLMIVSLTLFR